METTETGRIMVGWKPKCQIRDAGERVGLNVPAKKQVPPASADKRPARHDSGAVSAGVCNTPLLLT